MQTQQYQPISEPIVTQVLLMGLAPLEGRLLALDISGGSLRLTGNLDSLVSGRGWINQNDPFDLLVADAEPLRVRACVDSIQDEILEFHFNDRADPCAASLQSLYRAHNSVPENPGSVHSRLRAVSADHLQTLVESFVSDASQRLLEQFREAKSNQDQILCLEITAALQNAQAEIAAQLCSTVLSGIDKSDKYRASKARDAASVHIGQLEIVDKDSFEDTLAVNAVVARVIEKNHPAQEHLRQLYSGWLGETICDERLPVGVAMVCQAFKYAIAGLEIPASLRELIYQAFETGLQSEIPAWYAALIDGFSVQGIKARADDPASPDSIRENRIAPAVADKVSETQRSAAPDGGATVVSMGSPFARQDGALAQPLDTEKTRRLYDTVLSVMQLRNPQHEPPVAKVYDADLIDAITNMQQDKEVQRDIGEGTPLLQRVRQSMPGAEASPLSPALQNKAEVIETLFESIVDHQVTAPSAKPLLRRFAVPFLKLVMLDESFLADKSHPARQLLNQISVLAGSADVSSGLIERSLSGMLDRINAEYDGEDAALFAELLTEVDQLILGQQAAHSRNAERVAESYDGQQTLQDAHKAVWRALSERILGTPVPRPVLRLLDVGWRDLLVMEYCRNGANGKKFTGCLSLLDRLLAILRLLDDKATGDRAGIDKAECRSLVGIIDRELNAVFPGRHRHRDVVKQLRSLLLQEEGGLDAIEFVELDPTDDWYGVKLAEGESVRSVEQPEALRRWCERASELAIGDWIGDVHQSDRRQDLQLAWRSNDSSRFVFVNRLGRKEAEFRLLELASKMQQGWHLLEENSNWSPVDRGLYQILQKVYDELDVRRCNDELTQLLNRKEFENRVSQTVASSRRQGGGHVLLQIDLDQFSLVNDYCGVVAGDELLKEIAAVIQSSLPGNCNLSRLGGNEFGALLENTDIEQGRKKAEAIRLAIQKYRFEWQGKKYSLTASIGMSVMDEFSADVVNLFRDLGGACQLAKEEGRNRVVLATRESEERQKREDVLAWVARINRALDENRLTLRCQRIEPLFGEGEMPHYEVLLGVRDDKDNEILVPPDKFIAAAERFNRMQDVDRWVVENVVEWMKDNPATLETISGVSINLSGNSLNDDYFLAFLSDTMAGASELLPLICFEITETATIANLSKAADFIHAVKAMGCKFALDDFGTGLSSYEYLKRLPVDFLKIDGCFIKDIVDSSCDFAVVKSINEIGHFMGKKTIAEYVENDRIMGLLKEIGVDFAQGYGVEKPRLLSDISTVEPGVS